MNYNNTNKQKSENKKQNNNCNDEFNKKCEDDLGLASMSYADYILLASTLAYSLFKELDEDDLGMFIVFLYLVISDLQVLISQRAIIRAHCGQNQGESEEEDLEEDLEPEEAITSVSRSRKGKPKKRRYKGKKRST